jgi:hypothetical protein
VSPWWRDALHVRLAPHGLRIERRRRGLRPTVGEAFDEPVTPASGEAPPWQAAADALERCLQAPRFRGADLHVDLGAAFSRWLLLPWSAALATDVERLAYARLEFEAVHGERVRGWRLRLGDGRPGEPAPVCAIDDALGDRLDGIAVAAGARLVAVRPAFGAALDRHRRVLSAPGAAFALVEPGRCTIAAFEAGRWRHLESGRWQGRMADALAARLARIDALGICPGTPRRVHVLFDDLPEALPARLGDWDVVPVEERVDGPAARFSWGRT